MAQEMPLTRGFVALVDDEDLERVTSACSWSVAVSGAGRITGAQGQAGAAAENGRAGVLLHRFILGVTDPAIEVDHVDGDTLNNTRRNLRLTSRRENSRNRPSRSASGFKGVYRRPFGWYAQIADARLGLQPDGRSTRRRHLGNFATAEEAARAYDTAALEVDPVHAALNFPLAGRAQNG